MTTFWPLISGTIFFFLIECSKGAEFIANIHYVEPPKLQIDLIPLNLYLVVSVFCEIWCVSKQSKSKSPYFTVVWYEDQMLSENTTGPFY